MEQELLAFMTANQQVMQGMAAVLSQIQQQLGQQAQQQAQATPVPGAAVVNNAAAKGYVLDPRAYYSLKFEGKEDKWSEFYGKFTGTVTEQKPEISMLMKYAEDEEDPVTERDVIAAFGGNPGD